MIAGRQYGSRRNFAVGQHPVNKEEDGDAGGNGEHLHHYESHQPNESCAVAAQQGSHQRYVSRRQRNGQQRQHAAAERQPERDQLIAKVRAVIGKSPDAVQRDFQRHKYAGRGDQQNDQRYYLQRDAGCSPWHSGYGSRIPGRRADSRAATPPRRHTSRANEKRAGSASSAARRKGRRTESNWQRRRMQKYAHRFAAGT